MVNNVNFQRRYSVERWQFRMYIMDLIYTVTCIAYSKIYYNNNIFYLKLLFYTSVLLNSESQLVKRLSMWFMTGRTKEHKATSKDWGDLEKTLLFYCNAFWESDTWNSSASSNKGDADRNKYIYTEWRRRFPALVINF